MTAETTILFDVGMIIISATFLGMAAKFLRQPLIGAYILAGILIGPEVLGIVSNTDVIRMFAELGVAFLLFMVGLELDFDKLREVRKVVIGAAIAQILFIFAIGYFIMFFLGFTGFGAIYTGLFIAFSSTAVLVKLLADAGDIDMLHGRIVLGILLIQDVIVVMSLSVLSAFNNPTPEVFISALLTSGGLLALAVVISKYIAPPVLKTVEDSQEVIFLFSVAVLFIFVGAAVESGLSTAVGGFLAGISLTTFPYNVEIAERARPMRDFFVTIFFVSLGMLVSLSHLRTFLVPFLLLLGTVFVLKPFILSLMVSLFRYGKRTSFYTGLSLGQVSEFSMVVALVGLQMGHIGRGLFSMLTALMVVTVISTSYALRYQKGLYDVLGRFVIELENAELEKTKTVMEDHVIVCGGHIKGRKILRSLEDQHEEVVVVDHDPEVITWVTNQDGVNAVYGDIEDIHTLERLNVVRAKAVISTVPDSEDNRFLLDYMKKHNPEAVAIVSAEDIETALRLYDDGADYVLYPKMLAAREASDMVRQLYEDGTNLEEARTEHIAELEHEIEEEILKRFEPEFVQRLKDQMRKGVRRGNDN